ncbi:MAG: glycosyltransferase [Isosphaeraceae bacterium]
MIVPNYNHARYLRQRIDSILGQTFRNFELIILDDCSTDDSRAVIDEYTGDPRVITSFNDRNSGSTFRQWNNGLARARGDYVWIAESDDAAEPELLGTLVGQLDAHPSVGLAYCGSRVIDGDGRPQGLTHDALGEIFDVARWSSDYVNSGRDECEHYLFRWNTIPNASAVLLRRAIIDRIGWAPTQFRLTGDWWMYARVLLASDVAYVARPMNLYRKHLGTVRQRSEADDTQLRESYRVQAMIARSLSLPRTSRRRLAEGYAWHLMAQYGLDAGGTLSWDQMATLHRRARAIGLPVYRRVLATSLRAGARGVLGRMGLLSPIRRLKRPVGKAGG